MRTSPILGLLICSAIILNVAEAKPFFIKVFAPSSGYSYQATPTAAPANTQFISNLISQKLQLLNSFLAAKSSFGSFGVSKTISFNGGSTTTSTTTERPESTEVNTEFIPEVSSSTQSVSTTTTDEDIATPKPTVYPQPPIKTSTTSPVIPTRSTTEGYSYSTPKSTTEGYSYSTPKSTTEDEEIVESKTKSIHGYSYQTPTSRIITSSTSSSYYLPPSRY